jgi:hypothetical protein
VFTARYALSPYIKQIRFVFRGLIGRVVSGAGETGCACTARGSGLPFRRQPVLSLRLRFTDLKGRRLSSYVR